MIKAVRVLVVGVLLAFVGLLGSVMICGSAANLNVYVVIDFVVGATVIYGLYVGGSAIAKRLERRGQSER